MRINAGCFFRLLRLIAIVALICSLLIGAFIIQTRQNPSQTIAYVSTHDNRDEIQLHDLASDRTVWLDTGGFVNPFFDFSPDGRQIVFSNDDDSPEIVVMNLDNSDRATITRNTIFDHSPVWSPDGKRIAYIADSLLVINADGSEQRRLFRGFTLVYRPSWSPDGNMLAVTLDQKTTIIDANCAAAQNDCIIKHVSDQSSDDSIPNWSPDGHWIAFNSFRDGNMEIYKLNIQAALADPDCGVVDGACAQYQQRLTDNTAYDDAPDWSPDSQQIVFASDRDGDMEIFVMDADGSNQRQLTFNNTPDGWPKWRP